MDAFEQSRVIAVAVRAALSLIGMLG